MTPLLHFRHETHGKKSWDSKAFTTFECFQTFSLHLQNFLALKTPNDDELQVLFCPISSFTSIQVCHEIRWGITDSFLLFFSLLEKILFCAYCVRIKQFQNQLARLYSSYSLVCLTEEESIHHFTLKSLKKGLCCSYFSKIALKKYNSGSI